MFCIQWKLVRIIAAFEMCKALFPLPGSLLSLRIVLVNWKGHDICEELKKKKAPPPRARGQLLAQRALGARAEQLWQPWDVTLPSLWLAWGADLTAVLSFPNCFSVAFLSKPQGLVTPKKKGNGNKRRKGKGLGKKRDPCLRKYKDFCIHGECKYIRELGAPSCM